MGFLSALGSIGEVAGGIGALVGSTRSRSKIPTPKTGFAAGQDEAATLRGINASNPNNNLTLQEYSGNGNIGTAGVFSAQKNQQQIATQQAETAKNQQQLDTLRTFGELTNSANQIKTNRDVALLQTLQSEANNRRDNDTKRYEIDVNKFGFKPGNLFRPDIAGDEHIDLSGGKNSNFANNLALGAGGLLGKFGLRGLLGKLGKGKKGKHSYNKTQKGLNTPKPSVFNNGRFGKSHPGSRYIFDKSTGEYIDSSQLQHLFR